MTTEREQLEASAQMQLVKERMDRIIAYLDELGAKIEEKIRWNERAHKLATVAFLSHMALIIYGMFNDFSYQLNDAFLDASFFILMVATVRSVHFSFQASKLLGEYRGVINTLKIIGMVKDGDVPGNKRKIKVPSLNPYKRFKEFIERIGEAKKEQYA